MASFRRVISSGVSRFFGCRLLLMCPIFALVFTGMLCRDAAASPTGLNNIPTADVTPEKVLVFQAWGNYAHESSPSYFGGLKYGLLKSIEVGIDKKVGSSDEGPLTFQAKLQLPVLPEDWKLIPLVGVANISDDEKEAGEADPYAVLTLDLKSARAHLGYSFQEDNEAMFAGLDKTLKIFERDLVLRADVRQIDDGDELLSSAGFLHVLPWNFVLESWISIPSEEEREEILTVKLNYVLGF